MAWRAVSPRGGHALHEAVQQSLGADSIGLAAPRLLQGDRADAIPVLERGLAIARELNTQNWLPGFAALLGHAETLCGRVTEALALLEEAVSQAERSNRIGRGRWLSFRSEAYLLAGRPDDAIATAQHGLKRAHQRRERADEAKHLGALAEATAQTDPPDFGTAERLYREALTLAAELGMRPLVARCHAGLVKLCHRTGKRQEAHEHLTAATTMVPRDGHAVLAGKARGGAAGAPMGEGAETWRLGAGQRPRMPFMSPPGHALPDTSERRCVR